MRLLSLLFIAAAATGCGKSPDLEEWRSLDATPSETVHQATNASPEAIDSLRAAGDLAAARTMALQFAAMHPDDPEALWRASRAESDAVWLHEAGDAESRDKAAASALDYAQRADDAGADGAEAVAQYAWSMGNSTHLLPMMSRSSRARATDDIIDRALALDPANADALATRATLQLRLATLPRIAKMMASGAPKSSLADAEKFARAAVGSRASISNQLLLAKVLKARENAVDARQVLESALAREDSFPRDREIRPDAQALLDELKAGEEE